MRTVTCIAATLLLGVATLPAQENDPDRGVSGGGNLPTGWEARTDKGTNTDQVKLVTMGEGYHVTLGPRTILYREADAAHGVYTVTVTFTKAQAQRHAEAYGLIIGGSNLQGDDQQYSYFLIRGAGQFLVKNRNGSETSSVSGSWTAHPAIQAEDPAGNCSNTLSVEVGESQVRFLVNGAEVYAGPIDQFSTEGIPGMRVNHNLDLHIDGFAVERS
jgi:hypothetical protein